MGVETTSQVQLTTTANGTAGGVLTVSSTTDLKAGALAWLTNGSGVTWRIKILRTLSSTTLMAKRHETPDHPEFHRPDNYPSNSSGSNFSTFLTGSILVQPENQLIRVNP